VVFRGGSSIDPVRKGGTTDLMAKMLLRGTKNKTKAQIDLLLDQLGGAVTIATQSEHWIIQGSVLSKNIKPFVELLIEILTAPSFQASEFIKLKNEHLAHLNNLMDQDQALLQLRFQQEFFKGHPYARPSFGTVSEVRGIQVSDVVSFYKNTLPLQGHLILGVGDASESDIDPLESALRRTFPSSARFSDYKSLPFKRLQPRVVIFDKPDRTQTQIMIGQVGLPATSPDLDPILLSNHVFGGDSFHSRLMKELRVKRGWTYGAKSQIKLATQPHLWGIHFFPKSADTAPAIKETLKMITSFRDVGISADEFQFAQSALVNGAGFDFNTASKRLENKLLEKLLGLPDGFQQNQAER
jgi:zinc protease